MLVAQGGYFFFISSIIALTAVKTITNVSKIITSFIPISTPFTNKNLLGKGAEQPPLFCHYREYYIIICKNNNSFKKLFLFIRIIKPPCMFKTVILNYILTLCLCWCIIKAVTEQLGLFSLQ